MSIVMPVGGMSCQDSQGTRKPQTNPPLLHNHLIWGFWDDVSAQCDVTDDVGMASSKAMHGW